MGLQLDQIVVKISPSISEFFPMIRTCPRCLRVQFRGVRRHSTSVKGLLTETQVGKDVTVTGWINHKRKLKNATFLDITDGSTFQTLQVVAQGEPET